MDEQGSCSAPISEVDFRELYYSQAGGYEQVWQAPGAHSPTPCIMLGGGHEFDLRHHRVFKFDCSEKSEP